MADNYLDDIVQNIVTRCDISGFVELSVATKEAIKNAQKLAAAYRRTITPEQRVEMEALKLAQMKSAEVTSWNRVLLEQERNAMSANRVESARLTLEKQKNANATRLAYSETAKTLQLSRERVTAMRKEITEQRRLNRERVRGGFGWGNRIGTYIGAYFGLHTLKNIIDTGSRIQLVQKSIEGLTKSTQDWQYIQQQAFKTGTEIEVVAKGYRNFYSSAQMAGFSKEGIQSMYGDVLLASRAIGASTQQTEGALLALEQMLSKGTVSMEELRRQLGNAIPGAFEIGAKAMNMTTQEFNAFVKKGQLASAEFVPRFIKALTDTYAGGFAEIEQTVSVAQIRLSNSWKLLQADIISGETGKAFAQGLNTLRETLDSPEFKQFIVYLGKLFKLLMDIFSWVIKNLKLVLTLLGTAGLYKLLISHRSIWKLMTMDIGRAFQVMTRFIRISTHGFKALNFFGKSFLVTMLRVLAPLLLIEDLLFFIGEKFWGWNTKSAIGSMVAMNNRRNPNWNKPVINDPVFQKAFENPRIKQLMQEGKNLEAAKMLGGYEDMYGNWHSGYTTTTIPNLELNKTEAPTLNVKIGDINITGNLQNAEEIGNAVTKALANMFTASGLTLDAKTTTAGQGFTSVPSLTNSSGLSNTIR